MSLAIYRDQESPAPEPMSIFEQRIVHPDNQTRLDDLQARIDRFKPIPTPTLIKLQRRVKQLSRRLQRRGVFDRITTLNLYADEFAKVSNEYTVLRTSVDELITEGGVVDDDLIERGRSLKARGQDLQRRIHLIEQALLSNEDDYTEYIGLRDRLSEHLALVKRKAEEDKNSKQFYKEGKLIKKLLIEAFKMTEGCYIEKFSRNGKKRRIAPGFQEIWLSSHVHSFVLLTSKKTMFGWKNKLSVNIERLIDPNTTLKNASAILHRQVWVDWEVTGSLPIFKVNRLDIRDGLPSKVMFARMLEIYPVSQHEYVPIPAGLGENLRAHWMSFDTTPHLLVAGTSRSGKSNFLNAMICTLLYMQSPEELRIFAIDNKAGVEFWRYRNVPQLIDSVVDTGDQVLRALERCLEMMNKRLTRLKNANVKDIVSYNQHADKNAKMPRLVVFIDEMSTLLNREDTDQIHFALIKLTAQGAAAGVHVILATQYPNAETIPMTVKGNIEGLVGLRMPNPNASQMMFRTDDAYNLPRIKGRAYISDAGERYKLQTPYISDEEIDRAIRYACSEYKRTPFNELGSDDDVNLISAPKRKYSLEEKQYLILMSIHTRKGAPMKDIEIDTKLATTTAWRQLNKLVTLALITKNGTIYQITDTGIEALIEAEYLQGVGT